MDPNNHGKGTGCFQGRSGFPFNDGGFLLSMLVLGGCHILLDTPEPSSKHMVETIAQPTPPRTDVPGS